MAKRIIYLQVEARDVDADIRVNDIPVASGKRGKQRTLGIPLHEFVVPNTNLLSVTIEPQGQPLEAGAELLVRVASFEDGESLDPSAGRGFAVLVPSLAPSAPTPILLSAPFEIPPLQAPAVVWSWATAPVIASTASRASLDSYVAYLAALFTSGDAESLLTEVAPRLEETATAYPAVTLEDAIAGFHSRLSRISPDLRTPLDPEQLVYRVAANGRLVELLDRSGRPFLRQPSDSATGRADVELPAMIGIHQGRFRVLR